MRFAPVLLLSRALCLPTTAHPKGGHGGSSHASRSHATHSQSVSSVARGSRRRIKRDHASSAILLPEPHSSTITRVSRRVRHQVLAQDTNG